MVKAVSSAPNFDDIASFTVSGAAADFVYREGDAGKDMYIIQDGRIELLNDDAGKERQLEVLAAGDFFGELSLLEDQRRDASARAVTSFRLLRIDRTTLQRLVQENPDIAIRMLHRLASRLREHEEARLRAAEIAAGAMHPLPSRDVVQKSADVGAPDDAAEAAAPEPPADAAPSRPRLVHAASGHEFDLAQEGELVVGRFDRATGYTPAVDLTELDAKRTLSRRHAAITVQDDGVFICESKATQNGTFVNGERIATGDMVRLRNGDAVRFGLIETVFKDV